MKVFLGFSFRDQDKELVGHVDRLLASQHVQVATGEALGGEQLTPAVQARIDECDALVALLTRRDLKQSGGWTTHQWVLDELGYARNRRKRAIALVEDGVEVGGMFQPNEHISLDGARPTAALVRLSETIGLWKRELGRTVKVQLLPPRLAASVGSSRKKWTCSYRLCLQGKYTAWIEATPVPETGGTFIYVPGVQDDHLIQVKVRDAKRVWRSPATSQWLSVRLARGGGTP